MPNTGAAGHNWAGNIAFAAERVHRPTSLDELRRIVTHGQRVRALGTGHSFNRIADTPGDLVRMDGLPRRVEIAAERTQVTVSAGLRYAEVAAALQDAGLALANMASLPHISVGGSVATGTHGSGNAQRGLASSVSAVEVVGADGELRRVERAAHPGRFPGTVVSLGALGVVTSLTLDVEPSFEVAQWVHTGVPLDALASGFPEIFGAAYSVSVFTNWHRGQGTVWLKHRTDQTGRADQAGLVDQAVAGRPMPGWQGGTPAKAPWHPIPGLPAEFCTEQLGTPGPWHQRLPHFRPEFTPSHGEELQSEVMLPRPAAPAAFAALRAISDTLSPVLQISEIRTIAAEEQWLSPAYGRDSVAIHFTWIKETAAVLPVLAEVEKRLLPLGARPHWGKVTTLTPGVIAASYPRFAAFRGLVLDHDPGGRFRNAYLDELLAS